MRFARQIFRISDSDYSTALSVHPHSHYFPNQASSKAAHILPYQTHGRTTYQRRSQNQSVLSSRQKQFYHSILLSPYQRLLQPFHTCLNVSHFRTQISPFSYEVGLLIELENFKVRHSEITTSTSTREKHPKRSTVSIQK